MRSLLTALLSIGLAASAHGEDFAAMMGVAHQTWPTKTRIGVICNYAKNQEAIQHLAVAAGPGSTLLVMDTQHASQLPRAQARLLQRKMDYLVLMPEDPNFRDGAFEATILVGRMASRGIPTLGTTPLAIQQGAVFSIGEGTQGQLLLCPKPIGTVDVLMPTRIATTSPANTAAAQIEVE